MKYEPEGAFPAEAYAVVGDRRQPDTWKVRLWDAVQRKVTPHQLRIVEADLAAYDVVGLELTDEELVTAAKRLANEMDKLGMIPANHR